MVEASRRRNLVFISYSHQDKKWLDELLVFLKQYTRQELIQVWDDTKIPAGAKWKEEIAEALASTKVAVLLVTQHFLTSDYIANEEIPPLLQAARDEGLIFLWISISASAWRITPIKNYQAANDPAKPLDTLSKANRSSEWLKICEKIIKAAGSANEGGGIPQKETQEQLLLAGYFFVEHEGQEIILVRGDGRLPVTQVIKPQESTIEQSIDEAAIAFFKEVGIPTSQLIEASFFRPFYYRLYKNPDLEMRHCIFFKIGLNKQVHGTEAVWKEDEYRWEPKQRIADLWGLEGFWFGRDDKRESLLPKIEDPYKAILADRVNIELGLKVLECVDILIFRVNPEGQIEFLIIQRKSNQGWEYPKGGLYYHETPVEGALREAHEEVGIRRRYLHYCGYLGWQTADVRDRNRFYDTLRVHGLTFYYSGNPAEIELDFNHISYTWRTFVDAKASLWIPYGAEFFNRWKEKQNEILQRAGVAHDPS